MADLGRGAQAGAQEALDGGGSLVTSPAAKPAQTEAGSKSEQAWRLWTAANGVTVARIACTPLLVVLVLRATPSWGALVFWAVLAGTDAADGWLARRQGATASGAFLDPLADKALVLGALAAMVARGSVTLAPVALLAGREVVITCYRVVVARRGISVPARRVAKVKTLVEFVTVGLVLLPVAVVFQAHPGARRALWLAVALAWASGAQYLLDSRAGGAPWPQVPSTGPRTAVGCEVLAIGTELLLGQVVDTNSAWIGERLAAAGIPCYQQTKVGDNHARIVARCQGRACPLVARVICCGGLGPTQDDITREAIAEVMGVPLLRDPALRVRLLERFFAGRHVPPSNYKQADVPSGAAPILPVMGTAPGLICPRGGQSGLRRARGARRDAGDGRPGGRARPPAPRRVQRSAITQPLPAGLGGRGVRGGHDRGTPCRGARRAPATRRSPSWPVPPRACGCGSPPVRAGRAPRRRPRHARRRGGRAARACSGALSEAWTTRAWK